MGSRIWAFAAALGLIATWGCRGRPETVEEACETPFEGLVGDGAAHPNGDVAWVDAGLGPVGLASANRAAAYWARETSGRARFDVRPSPDGSLRPGTNVFGCDFGSPALRGDHAGVTGRDSSVAVVALDAEVVHSAFVDAYFVHEFGHVLGLGHSTDPDSPMYTDASIIWARRLANTGARP